MGNLHPARSERPELNERELIYITLHTHFTRKQINEFYSLYSNELKHLKNSRPLLERLFHHIDTDKNGQSNTSEIYCEFLFQAFNCLLSDGFIQFDEYLLGIYIHSNVSTSREKLEWLYNAYDRDDDGFINYNEINQIVHALFILYGIDREKYNVAYLSYEIMDILDLNNDDKISKQEFINMIKDKELTKFLAPSLIKQS